MKATRLLLGTGTWPSTPSSFSPFLRNPPLSSRSPARPACALPLPFGPEPPVRTLSLESVSQLCQVLLVNELFRQKNTGRTDKGLWDLFPLVK